MEGSSDTPLSLALPHSNNFVAEVSDVGFLLERITVIQPHGRLSDQVGLVPGCLVARVSIPEIPVKLIGHKCCLAEAID